MEITGKSLQWNVGVDKRDATIDVSPDDLKLQLKHTKVLRTGDTVWLEGVFVEPTPEGKFVIRISDKEVADCCHIANPESIIAAFPAEPEKEKEELSAKINAKDCDDAVIGLSKALNYFLNSEVGIHLIVVKEKK